MPYSRKSEDRYSEMGNIFMTADKHTHCVIVSARLHNATVPQSGVAQSFGPRRIFTDLVLLC
jgi:hypothetical protein